MQKVLSWYLFKEATLGSETSLSFKDQLKNILKQFSTLEKITEFALYCARDCLNLNNQTTINQAKICINLIERSLSNPDESIAESLNEEASKSHILSLNLDRREPGAQAATDAITATAYAAWTAADVVESRISSAIIHAALTAYYAVLAFGTHDKEQEYLAKARDFASRELQEDLPSFPQDIVTKIVFYINKAKILLPPELQYLVQQIEEIINNLSKGIQEHVAFLENTIKELENSLSDYESSHRRFIVDYPNKETLAQYNKFKAGVMILMHIVEFVLEMGKGKNAKTESEHLFGLIDALFSNNYGKNRLNI